MENKDKETKKQENKEIRKSKSQQKITITIKNKTFLYEYDKMSGRG